MLGVLKKFTVKNWLSVLAILAFTFGQVYFTMQIVTGLNTLTEAVQRAFRRAEAAGHHRPRHDGKFPHAHFV